jgi:ADP-L-glycero-D-manno-heptose 6-epimerase
MIVVTGSAGFISSCLVSALNEKGFNDIVVVDDFSKTEKSENLLGKTLLAKVPRIDFFKWAEQFKSEIDFVFHLGARTDTTEFDKSIFDELNMKYSQDMWELCAESQIPLVYASSAATYGLGEFGYEDNHEVIEKLKPLNPYGDSKNDFDKWALKQENSPPFWAGLKFFNVYGPNEYHKGRMASVIMHAFKQINETKAMKLFASHNPDFKDGEQLRDFVYVKDVVSVCLYLQKNRPENGLYNLGTGTARTFNDLVIGTFKALGIEPSIAYIPTPEDIRDKYQYFTEAKMDKLIKSGYSKKFYTLEEGVEDYVKNYLVPNKYL